MLALVVANSPVSSAEPPFSGTIFIDPDIITAADPTTFTSLVYTGQATRTMFDRRSGAFANYYAFLFQASYSDGLTIEVQVNPEYGSSAAAQQPAQYFAPVIGRLPKALRTDVQTVWIHRGDEAFGGGNNNLLIHTGSIAQGYIDSGILEETFVHEAAHTSLDPAHAAAQGWIAAQDADAEFISTYARDFPTREDIAESFLPWLAVRHASIRIAASLADTITATIPNRLVYFDALGLDLSPMTDNRPVFDDSFEAP